METLDHKIYIGCLLELYKATLTDKQVRILDMMYNLDMSLAEIADAVGGISRQAARDTAKRAEAALCDLESKIGLYDLLNKVAQADSDEKLKALKAQLEEKYGFI